MQINSLIIGHGISIPDGIGIWFLCAVLSLIAVFAGLRKNKPRPLWSIYVGEVTAICGVAMMIGLRRGGWDGPFVLFALIPIFCGAICLLDDRVLRHKILTVSVALLTAGVAMYVMLFDVRGVPEVLNLAAVVLIVTGMAGVILFRPREA